MPGKRGHRQGVMPKSVMPVYLIEDDQVIPGRLDASDCRLAGTVPDGRSSAPFTPPTIQIHFHDLVEILYDGRLEQSHRIRVG
jgi:hypothetical protein